MSFLAKAVWILTIEKIVVPMAFLFAFFAKIKIPPGSDALAIMTNPHQINYRLHNVRKDIIL